MTVHGTEDGTFLHVCSFPGTHVFLYTNTKIQVVDRTNTTIYNRTVNVENHCKILALQYLIPNQINGDKI